VKQPPASKSPPPPPPPPKAPAKPVFKPSQESGSPILRFGADDASPSNADSKPTPGPIYYKDLPSYSSADQEEQEDEPIYSPPSPLSTGGSSSFPDIDEDTFPSAVENTVSQFVEPVGTDDVGEISPFSYFSGGRDAINIVEPPQVFYGRYTSGEDKTTPPPPRPTVDTSSHSRYPEVSDTYRLYPNYPPLDEGHSTPATEEDSAFPYAFIEEETQSEGSEAEHLQSERDLTDEVDVEAEFDEGVDGDEDVDDTLQEIKNALDANSGGHPLFAPDRPKDTDKGKDSNINYLPEKKKEKPTTKKITVTEKPAIKSTFATTEGAKYTYKTYKDLPITTTKVPPQASGKQVVKEQKPDHTTDTTGLFVSPQNQLGKNFPSQKNFQIPDDIRDAEIKPPSWINMENW